MDNLQQFHSENIGWLNDKEMFQNSTTINIMHISGKGKCRVIQWTFVIKLSVKIDKGSFLIVCMVVSILGE